MLFCCSICRDWPSRQRAIIRTLAALAIGLAATTRAASAQTATTDSEEQRHRAQREAEERQSRQQAADVHLPSPPPAPEIEGAALPEETPCFRIDSLRLEGNRLDAFAWLGNDLDAYAGRCIGREGIGLIAKRLNARLIAAGYVTTRIGIPEQRLSEGVLRLVLVPGVIRDIRFADETPAGDWRSAFPVRPGDILNLRDLEQGLEQLKRVPSQEVDMEIVPGTSPGESDIVVKVKRIAPLRLSLSLDDSGAKSTGKRQAAVTVSIDNPLGLNDLVTASLNSDAQNQRHQHGTRGHSFQYSVPWGYWTFSVSDSASHYQQRIQGATQTFVSSGDSTNQEIKVQRVVYRGQRAKTTLQFRASQRAQHSYVDDSEIMVQRRRTAAAEAGVQHRHQIGGLQLDISLARRDGAPWLGGKADAPGRAPGAPTYEYRMYIADISALASFRIGEQHVRWIGAFHGQATRDALYTADQIAIGNRFTVRGFDGETTLSAERGHYLRNELEFALGQTGQAFYLAIDAGRVGGPSTSALVGRSLAGTAMGLRGVFQGLSYDVFSSRALRKPEGFASVQPALGFQLGYLF